MQKSISYQISTKLFVLMHVNLYTELPNCVKKLGQMNYAQNVRKSFCCNILSFEKNAIETRYNN
jgi:hypothetical protein